MDQNTKNTLRARRHKTLGCVLTVLFLASASLWPAVARSGGFHGGQFHGGFPAFHGGGFHGGFHEFHRGMFPDGRFGRFHGRRFFLHHGFRRGFVVVPAFGLWWWGGGWGWPNYPYYGNGPYSWYWYCPDPPGYYPYVTQCSAPWQTIPAG